MMRYQQFTAAAERAADHLAERWETSGRPTNDEDEVIRVSWLPRVLADMLVGTADHLPTDEAADELERLSHDEAGELAEFLNYHLVEALDRAGLLDDYTG